MKQHKYREDQLIQLLSNFVSEQQDLTNKFAKILLHIQPKSTSLQQQNYDILNDMNTTDFSGLKKKVKTNSDYSFSLKGKQKVRCQHCNKEYVSKLPLRTHLEKVHQDYSLATQGNSVENHKSLSQNNDPIYSSDDDSVFQKKQIAEDVRQKLMQNVNVIDKRVSKMDESSQQELNLQLTDSDNDD